jgi:hypothetical protein
MNATLKEYGTQIGKTISMALVFIAVSISAQAQANNVTRPTGATVQQQAAQSNALVTTNGVQYHGGPVMLGHTTFTLSGMETGARIMPQLFCPSLFRT